MKKFLLLSAGIALSMSAMAQTTFYSVADTWIRENNGSWKPAANQLKTVEISGGKEVKDADDNVIKNDALFVALYGFDFNVPAGMKVQEATLHLVTERYKGNPVTVYGYGNDFTEGDACWNVEASYIADAFATTPAATFTPAGQKGKAIFDKGINEENQNIAAWTNDVDITAYVKSLPATTHRVNLLLTQDHKDQVCFYTRDMVEPGDAFQNEDGTFVTQIPAEQLQPYLVVTFAEDSDSSTDVFSPTADTYVRNTAANQRYGDKGDMEIYSYTTDEGNDVIFAGLISFPLPAEINSANYELNGVELRLVTTYMKGDRIVEIYPYNYDFTDDVKYETAGVNVEAELANEPIMTFSAKGQGNKAMSDDGITEEYGTVEAWTNYIDLTEYVKENLPMNNLSLMLIKPDTSNRAVKFGTKEATDVTTKDGLYTFAGKDLKPQLVVSYTKVNGGTDEPDPDQPEQPGEDSAVQQVVIDLSAPAEFYNMHGVKVANPDKGVYIVRQGNVTKKVVF